MRISLLAGTIALGLLIADPAICAQNSTLMPDGSQPMPGETEDPTNPNPVPDPSNLSPPVTQPLPPEMPIPAGEAQNIPPAQPPVENRDAPMGPMATPPSSGQDNAVSGGTTSAMMTPIAATKEYPPCTRTLQDGCTNPGERNRTSRKPR